MQALVNKDILTIWSTFHSCMSVFYQVHVETNPASKSTWKWDGWKLEDDPFRFFLGPFFYLANFKKLAPLVSGRFLYLASLKRANPPIFRSKMGASNPNETHLFGDESNPQIPQIPPLSWKNLWKGWSINFSVKFFSDPHAKKCSSWGFPGNSQKFEGNVGLVKYYDLAMASTCRPRPLMSFKKQPT